MSEEIIAICRDYNFLSERSDEISVEKEKDRVKRIALELKRTANAYNLSSLSAIQINEPVRMFAINFRGDIRVFVNPMVVESKGLELSEETCSSIPDKTYLMPRSVDIVLAYQTTSGRIRQHKFIGMAAKTVLHCLDHLDGILISDYGLEIDDDYRNASDEEKVEVINAYMDSMRKASERLHKEIEEDDDLKQMSDAIDFLEKVQKGEVHLTQERVEVVNNAEYNKSDSSKES